MKKKDVAIMGATSHIAKTLIERFLRHGGFRLHLYTRSPRRLGAFLAAGLAAEGNCVVHKGYSRLLAGRHDVLINCVGVGTGAKLRGDYTKWFTVSEEYDNLALSCLKSRPAGTLYISFSSGAVYGSCLSAPAGKDTANILKVNNISSADYYGIARLNSEAKHRSFSGLNIVDLRVFSYFSRHIDLSDGYFMSELVNAALRGKEFRTTAGNIRRDYVHPDDLFRLVCKCMAAGRLNAAFDVYSARPVSKSGILAFFKRRYGVVPVKSRAPGKGSATGAKNLYYSSFHSAGRLGYAPRFTSLRTIMAESEAIISPPPGTRGRSSRSAHR